MRLRWWQRGGRDSPELEIAWEDAIEVDVVGYKYHEAKWHPGSGSILLRRSGGGGTVLEADNKTVIIGGNAYCAECGRRKKKYMPCPHCNDMVCYSD